MTARNSVLEWLIIGGGVHGTYLSNALIRNRVTRRSDLRVLDPHDEPLREWKKCTGNVGMKYLRSPKVHHLDLEPFSLKHFAICQSCDERLYIPPNDRPSLELFNRHAEYVIDRNGLQKLRIKDVALRIEPGRSYHTVFGSDHIYKTKNIVIAAGNGKPFWPDWAAFIRNEGAKIMHVLDDCFDKKRIPEQAVIAVVGGGMSAVQTAISLASEHREVVLISPHSIRVNNYDSDPGWMGPKYLQKFRSEPNYNRRRRWINEARNRGSVTQELYSDFSLLRKNKQCRFYAGKVELADPVSSEMILLHLNSGEVTAANAIVLATGFEQGLPGGKMISGLVRNHSFRCASCGFPIPSNHLEWWDGIYLSGTLGELETGPSAPNLIGARMAANKILSSVRK